MRQKRGKLPIIKTLLVLLIMAAAAFAVFRYMQIRQAGQDADAVLDNMYRLIPGLGKETEISTGQGRDPLAVMSINDVDIVGCLEIPSIDIIAPVTDKDYEKAGFVTMVSGSPIKGAFLLTGNRSDVFRDLASARPGDNVIFTDVDGVRYNYRVLTQFHLKKWDEADEDLMLCYQTDEQTQFVLGCKRAD